MNRTTLITIAVAFVLGLLVGFYVAEPDDPKPEAPAAEERREDGSVVLERDPTRPVGPPPAALPPGSAEERRVEVTLIPKPAASCAAPEPVRVVLSLARMPDGSARVVASSPDGTIAGGLDVPITPGPAIEPVRRWAAGASWAPGAAQQALGLWVERDLWRLRIGAEVNQTGDGDAEARVRVGINF